MTRARPSARQLRYPKAERVDPVQSEFARRRTRASFAIPRCAREGLGARANRSGPRSSRALRDGHAGYDALTNRSVTAFPFRRSRQVHGAQGGDDPRILRAGDGVPARRTRVSQIRQDAAASGGWAASSWQRIAPLGNTTLHRSITHGTRVAARARVLRTAACEAYREAKVTSWTCRSAIGVCPHEVSRRVHVSGTECGGIERDSGIGFRNSFVG